MEWDEVEKKQRKSMVRYSTGRTSPIRHSSGALLKNRKRTRKNYPGEDPALVEKRQRLEESKERRP